MTYRNRTIETIGSQFLVHTGGMYGYYYFPTIEAPRNSSRVCDMTPEQDAQRIRQLEFQLYKAEHGHGHALRTARRCSHCAARSKSTASCWRSTTRRASI
jgi:hypothetical protein